MQCRLLLCAATLFACFTSLVHASPLTPEAAVTCASGVHVIVARGTFEAQGYGLQRIVVDAIKKRVNGSDSVAVVYGTSSYTASTVAAGVKAMNKLVQDYATACPNTKQVLMGYSQGAQVTGDVVSGGGTNTTDGQTSQAGPPLPADIGAKLAAIIVFGDPDRQAAQSYNVDTCTDSAKYPRTGQVAVTFNSYSPIIQSYCNKDDPACCRTGKNVFAHLAYFNSTNAKSVASFVAARVGA